ncbi:MAG: hypothetical protein ACYDIC_19160, partial [Desulfobaccales bacterium]
MRDLSGLMGGAGSRRGCTRLLILFLCLGLMGCAGSTTVAPSPPPSGPLRVPVRVSQPPAKSDNKAVTALRAAAKADKERREEGGREDSGMQQFATAIKKVPLKHRQPKAGEKVYPLDLNLKGADLVEAIRVLADTLGLNYTVDSRVKGTVNVRASGKLTEADILGI